VCYDWVVGAILRRAAAGLLPALIPAWACAQTSEGPVFDGTPFVEGRLLFDGKPLSETTTAQPRLWFRNEDTNEGQAPEVDPRVSDLFSIAGLESGRYLITVYVDAEPENPTSARGYPGDYYAGWPFQVLAAQRLDIPLRRVIHLTEPQDNAAPLEGWDEPCEGKPAFAGRVPFSWEPLDPEARYTYSVRRVKCPYEDLGEARGGTTGSSRVELELAASAPGEFYLFNLEGRKLGRSIGGLMTRGAHGEGTDYRFRVKGP